MFRRLLLPFVVLCGCSNGTTQDVMVTQDFAFTSSNRSLSGVIDQPTTRAAKALMIFVHGSGATNIRAENRYADLRRRFVELGIACAMWDKPGNGRSEGTFDPNQPLEESAQEVIDAVAFLQKHGVPGANMIGVWSTSRGSWVAPIALSRESRLRFWISVSGAPPEDNKFHLIAANLPLEGRTPAQTARLLAEWKEGRRLFLAGADYDAYLAATENLRQDAAVNFFAGDVATTREAYAAEQSAYLRVKDRYQFDENYSLILVPNFDRILSKLNIDVLAVFGEKDTNMDWRRARALYESTIGRNPQATLTVRTFPDGSHNLGVTRTGSVREVEGVSMSSGVKSAGYYETQVEWIKKVVAGTATTRK